MSSVVLDDRQKKIVALVKKHGFVSIEDLAERLSIAKGVVRRELAIIEKAGEIVRMRGGAALPTDDVGDLGASERRQINGDAKLAMAKAAGKHIIDEGTYFLDSSTTVEALIPYLKKRKAIIVVTNSVYAAGMLAEAGIKTYLAGGLVNGDITATVGYDAIDYLEGFYCDTFIFSCRGISLDGPGESNAETQRIKRMMLEHSSNHILVVDSAKFGISMLTTICELDEIDVVITNEKPADAYRKAFEAAGIELVVAK